MYRGLLEAVEERGLPRLTRLEKELEEHGIMLRTVKG